MLSTVGLDELSESAEESNPSEPAAASKPSLFQAYSQAIDRWQVQGLKSFYLHSASEVLYVWDQAQTVLHRFRPETEECTPVWSANDRGTAKDAIWQTLPLPPTDAAATTSAGRRQNELQERLRVREQEEKRFSETAKQEREQEELLEEQRRKQEEQQEKVMNKYLSKEELEEHRRKKQREEDKKDRKKKKMEAELGNPKMGGSAAENALLGMIDEQEGAQQGPKFRAPERVTKVHPAAAAAMLGSAVNEADPPANFSVLAVPPDSSASLPQALLLAKDCPSTKNLIQTLGQQQLRLLPQALNRLRILPAPACEWALRTFVEEQQGGTVKKIPMTDVKSRSDAFERFLDGAREEMPWLLANLTERKELMATSSDKGEEACDREVGAYEGSAVLGAMNLAPQLLMREGQGGTSPRSGGGPTCPLQLLRADVTRNKINLTLLDSSGNYAFARKSVKVNGVDGETAFFGAGVGLQQRGFSSQAKQQTLSPTPKTVTLDKRASISLAVGPCTFRIKRQEDGALGFLVGGGGRKSGTAGNGNSPGGASNMLTNGGGKKNKGPAALGDRTKIHAIEDKSLKDTQVAVPQGLDLVMDQDRAEEENIPMLRKRRNDKRERSPKRAGKDSLVDPNRFFVPKKQYSPDLSLLSLRRLARAVQEQQRKLGGSKTALVAKVTGPLIEVTEEVKAFDAKYPGGKEYRDGFEQKLAAMKEKVKERLRGMGVEVEADDVGMDGAEQEEGEIEMDSEGTE